MAAAFLSFCRLYPGPVSEVSHDVDMAFSASPLQDDPDLFVCTGLTGSITG